MEPASPTASTVFPSGSGVSMLPDEANDGRKGKPMAKPTRRLPAMRGGTLPARDWLAPVSYPLASTAKR
jgi:hypothetical protein